MTHRLKRAVSKIPAMRWVYFWLYRYCLWRCYRLEHLSDKRFAQAMRFRARSLPR